MPQTSNTPATAAARVLIVDDHPAVREALAARIAMQSGLTVAGEAESATEALRLVSETDPDVAVIDIGLKDSNGIDLIKRLKARGARVATIVWSMHSESMYAERALRAGAMGYITKEQATDKIIAAIRCVLGGKVYVSDEMSARLVQRVVSRRAKTAEGSPMESLSDRELQTFELIGKGLATDEIAERLHLSIKTVETYRARIKEKLRIKSANELIHQAVLWAMEGA
jgi:DNA-binding NarL/FixJ family response regulator